MFKKKKVLVVDDEFYVRDMVACALEDEYLVLQATDGKEAIGLARRQKPDLILMDIILPKLDGISVCSILKTDSRTKAIPVVMLSGRTDRMEPDTCKAIGADDYLTKPFDIQELTDKVMQY